MSRYVCHFSVNLQSANIRSSLRKLAETCGLETIYDLDDYLMAREIPGRVAFAKLVTAEVLIDTTQATSTHIKLSFVVKNEELPLKSNNHCRQIFDLLRATIARDFDWQPLSAGQSTATAPVSKSQSDRFGKSDLHAKITPRQTMMN
jgi:hypothetical protein